MLSITTSDATQAAEVLESGSRVVAALVGLAVSAFLLLRIDWALGLGRAGRRPVAGAGR